MSHILMALLAASNGYLLACMSKSSFLVGAKSDNWNATAELLQDPMNEALMNELAITCKGTPTKTQARTLATTKFLNNFTLTLIGLWV
jgi:hypothetical protein